MRILFPLLIVSVALPAHAAAPNAALMLSRMEGADANRDGQITRAELIAFRAANFSRLDRDGNGMLTRSDVPAFAKRLNPSLDINALITQFDINRDGQVSRAEFVNGPTAVFDEADRNKDGILTRAERAAARTAAGR
jgi:hypothetical protein